VSVVSLSSDRQTVVTTGHPACNVARYHGQSQRLAIMIDLDLDLDLDVVSALGAAGLRVEFLQEHDWIWYRFFRY
jgi:hypothetical protein